MATNQYSIPGYAPRVSALFAYAEPSRGQRLADAITDASVALLSGLGTWTMGAWIVALVMQ